MKKLLFAGHDLKFAKFLIDHYSDDKNFEVRIDNWSGHNLHNEEKSRNLLDWADIIFCEWGLGNAVWYSNNKRENQKLIIRMHLQERETEFPNKINYNNVDRIIAISPYIYEELYRKFKLPRDKMTMIYNNVDCNKFDYKKDINYIYNIAIVGILPKRKRLDKAIDIIEGLNKFDKRYKLYIKGKHPNDVQWLMNKENERIYYEDIFKRINSSISKENIIFEDHSDNIGEWFKKIGFVLSTSDFESFHLAPMEGMASGAYPIIFNWDGCDTIYKAEWIVNSIDEAIDKIIKYEAENNYINYMKDFVKNNFGKEVILEKYKEII
ncbi:glycosyltransferase [Clostridium tertium]|uniref:glycosyltransferase n=2 Tax=Clostridium tertium TaxID=1559 RepID=UPI00232D851C|nr:glycosyltransferase [Clostridium tertium]MDB1953759.1 glycosyltransferase [Clostridium tertium]MDB1960234.1 glycosyltransferase [Clostridium tertium]MDB1964007.1 glycosyltransferase [Clostridium tertium]MDB1964431.1 glycosyltransferase [Clostridium tertium]MDY4605873.1 glycosyltransferase [Clostridium tertium]